MKIAPAFGPSSSAMRRPTTPRDPSFALQENEAPSQRSAHPATGTSGFRPLLIASGRPSPQEMTDLVFLFDTAFEHNPSPVKINIAKKFLMNWQPPKEDLRFLKDSAANVAQNYFRIAAKSSAEHAEKWQTYGKSEKKSAILDFLKTLNKSLNTSFNIRFIDTPNINGQENNGFYEPSSNTIVINLNSPKNSFGDALITVFHEAVHGIYFHKTANMSPEQILKGVQNGTISYTAAVAKANLTHNLYMNAHEDGWMNYSLNPHENLAHSGHTFFERELESRGIKFSPSLPDGHPILLNIKRHRL